MVLARAFSPVLDLVYPPRCPACGTATAGHGGLCAACFSGLVVPGDPACRACQTMFAAIPGEDALCDQCRETPPIHDGVTAATLYNDASRGLVLALKHGRQLALVPMMARMLARRVTVHHGESLDGWLVVPVPLHRWRLWRRGFNQSALLARALAREQGGRLLVDGLIRHRATPSLGGLDAAERATAVADAISVRPRHAGVLAGARVLLVDDVLTSGATSNACVAALRAAGAAHVRIACFARVMRHR